MALCHYQHKTRILGIRPLPETSRRRSAYSLYQAEASVNHSFSLQCGTGEKLYNNIEYHRIGLSQGAGHLN